MKISFWYIGKHKQDYIDDGIAIFKKRIQHYCKFDIKGFNKVKHAEKLPPEELKKKEGHLYINELQPGDQLILLDEKGKEFNSRQFAAYIEYFQVQSAKHVVFAIGGAYGFSDELKAKSAGKVSLSKMTFSHQLIRIIFLEQLYRAFTIINGEKYHND